MAHLFRGRHVKPWLAGAADPAWLVRSAPMMTADNHTRASPLLRQLPQRISLLQNVRALVGVLSNGDVLRMFCTPAVTSLKYSVSSAGSGQQLSPTRSCCLRVMLWRWLGTFSGVFRSVDGRRWCQLDEADIYSDGASEGWPLIRKRDLASCFCVL